MVDRTGLENRRAARSRGFESLSLRQVKQRTNGKIDAMRKCPESAMRVCAANLPARLAWGLLAVMALRLTAGTAPLIVNEPAEHFFVVNAKSLVTKTEGKANAFSNLWDFRFPPEVDCTERGVERYVDALAGGNLTHLFVKTGEKFIEIPPVFPYNDYNKTRRVSCYYLLLRETRAKP